MAQCFSLYFPWQISPEALRGDFSSLETETKHLQAQLSDCLKELHQKELRIQHLNSKVQIIFSIHRVWAEECEEEGGLE